MSALATWVLALMMILQPRAPWLKTYERTARAIATAAQEAPPLFEDDEDRSKTAALLVSIAWFEGSFNPAAKGKQGELGTFQAKPGKLAPEAFRPDFPEDVETQARVALRMVRQSFASCKRNRPEERLAEYTSGFCDAGLEAARNRWSKARWLARRYPFIRPT